MRELVLSREGNMGRNINECTVQEIKKIFSKGNQEEAQKKFGHKPNSQELIDHFFGESGEHLSTDDQLAFQARNGGNYAPHKPRQGRNH